MIKYRVVRNNQSAIMTIDSGWETIGPIDYEGDASLVDFLSSVVPNWIGVHGHMLTEVCMPVDFNAALMNHSYLFTEVSLLEGIIGSGVPKLPSNAPKDTVT